jgi:hypothetical protein
MHATTKLSKQAPTPALNKQRVRMLLDEQIYAQAIKVTAPRPVKCRCPELQNDPKVICPTHWLSMQMVI